MSCHFTTGCKWIPYTWWGHQMETFSALLAICAGNSPVTGEFLAQRPVTRSSDIFFDLRMNKPLSKQWWCGWFETISHPLWRHCYEYFLNLICIFWLIKGLRPVLEGFVVTMHKGACETGSQIPRALARGIWRTVRTSPTWHFQFHPVNISNRHIKGTYEIEARAVSRAPPIVTSHGAP